MWRFILRHLAVAGLLLWGVGALAEHYTVPLLVPAGTSGEPQGVLRLLNATAESGTVEIYAIDDAGTRSGPATFTLNASAAVQFTATDLASGNATLGLTGGIGADVGDARLEIETDLEIVPLAFVRAADGTLSAMHDTVRGASADESGQHTYDVPIFNPATEMTQVSRLRLINPGDAAAAVTISGRDDNGAEATGGDVTLMLTAGGAKTLTAQQLEAGDTDLTGQLGAGTGKWRLTVSSDQPLEVVNIVASTAGYWNNLSTTAVAGAAPADEAGFNERFVGNSVIYETGSGRSTVAFADGNRFTDTVEADGVTESYMGSFSYRALGPDAGRLTLDYDDGDACRANLYFSTRTSGWFASHCTGADHPADGTWLGGTWTVEATEDDGDDGAGEVADTTYEVNDALPGVPTSGFFIPAVTSGGSVTFTADGTTMALTDGGYIELNDGTRYTCASADGCSIVNGTVTAGSVTGRAAGAGEVDRFPSFRTAINPGDQSYTVGTAIDTLTLPEATGGNGDPTYSLSPSVPGLTFNATTRQLTGTPTTAGRHAMTYTVTDEDGDTDTLAFTITISAGAPTEGSLGVCQVGMTLSSGQSCTYPDTTDEFSVNDRGRGRFLSRLAGIRIRLNNETIDGRVYDFEASHQGDGVWRIDRVAGSTEPPTDGGNGGGNGGGNDGGNGGGNGTGGTGTDTSPSFSGVSEPGNQTYTVGTAIDTLTLPEASGGDGTIIYSLSPSVPGLTFNATTRQLTGTPSTAASYDMTYTATDEDGDADTLDFEITVAVSGDGNGNTQTGMAYFELNLDNDDPDGITFADDRFYVVDGRDGKVYAYQSSGQRDAASDFDLDFSNSSATGIAFADGKFHVLDVLDDKVYAYEASGQRDAASDFDLDSQNGNPHGITFADQKFFVTDDVDDKVYAYQASGQRDAASDFSLDANNGSPLGITFANGRFHVADSGDLDWVFAYSASGQRDSASDFHLDSNADSPSGITFAADSFYVINNRFANAGNSDRVYVVASIQQSPELVLRAMSASDDAASSTFYLSGITVTTDDSFRARTTVLNRGTRAAAATTLRFYRSDDSTISTDDTAVGTVQVEALSPAATTRKQIGLTAPSTAGTYYYGACVDSVAEESETDNNCSSGVLVTVREPQPDLLVESASVSDTTPDSDGSFELGVTVRNQGTGASTATTLRYYRSDDRTISTVDTEVGTDSLSALAVDGDSSHSITLSAPMEAGTHYYGACVDEVTEESNTTNNCSSAVPVFGGGPFPAYDLEISSATLHNPFIGFLGRGFDMSVTVVNRGPNRSQPAKLRFGSVSHEDIPALDPDATTTIRSRIGSVRFGTTTYRACIVEAPGEQDTTNNCVSRTATYR